MVADAPSARFGNSILSGVLERPMLFERSRSGITPRRSVVTKTFQSPGTAGVTRSSVITVDCRPSRLSVAPGHADEDGVDPASGPLSQMHDVGPGTGDGVVRVVANSVANLERLLGNQGAIHTDEFDILDHQVARHGVSAQDHGGAGVSGHQRG